MSKTKTILFATFAGVALAACRGEISHKPPIHLVQNMDFQDKLKAQSESKFKGWKDGRGMRKPVPGTMARGALKTFSPDADTRKLHTYKAGQDKDGKDLFVKDNPVPATLANLQRGRERYNIHCAVCHGRSGRGDGIVGRKFAVRPPSFVPAVTDEAKDARGLSLSRHDPRVEGLSHGEIFNVITNGWSTMQAYGNQVDVRDRWCIAHYIKALQLRAKN